MILSAYMAKSSISPVFGPYSLGTRVDNGAQLVQRRKLPVIAAEAAPANAQSTMRLVLNTDGARVDWGRGQFYDYFTVYFKMYYGDTILL